MAQYYTIAGLTVEMDSFGKTLARAKTYSCEPVKKADIQIAVNRKDLQLRQPQLSEDDCEYLCTGADFYTKLLAFDGMMLHASALIKDGKAYLFTAPSGTGKSTHTALWKEAFGETVQMLNDDKPAMRLENGVWYAYGTPWSGKYDISTNARAPIAGIALLERAADNSVAPVSGKEAIAAILEQTIRPSDAVLLMKLLKLLDDLMGQVPIWRLHCNMEPDAAHTAYKTMQKGRVLENEA